MNIREFDPKDPGERILIPIKLYNEHGINFERSVSLKEWTEGVPSAPISRFAIFQVFISRRNTKDRGG